MASAVVASSHSTTTAYSRLACSIAGTHVTRVNWPSWMASSGTRCSTTTVDVGTPLLVSRICTTTGPPLAVNHRSMPAVCVATSSTNVCARGSK